MAVHLEVRALEANILANGSHKAQRRLSDWTQFNLLPFRPDFNNSESTTKRNSWKEKPILEWPLIGSKYESLLKVFKSIERKIGETLIGIQIQQKHIKYKSITADVLSHRDSL